MAELPFNPSDWGFGPSPGLKAGELQVIGSGKGFTFFDDGSTGFYAETVDGPICFAEEGRKIGKWVFIPEPQVPSRAVRRAEAEFTARIWKLNAERNAS